MLPSPTLIWSEQVPTITFGTSGWRAIIAEEFTFRNVEIVTRAIARHVLEHPGPTGEPRVVIGYDGRFMADLFAKAVALTLANEGVRVLLPHRSIPTPVVSLMVREHELSGGIVLTASHNPPEYGGMKFSPADGAPASTDVTRSIAKRANALMEQASEDAKFPAIRAAQQDLIDDLVNRQIIERYDPYTLYRARLFQIIDVDVLQNAGITVTADVLYGAGRGYLPDLLREAGCQVTTLHDEDNPLFGGRRPDPVGDNVQELSEHVRETDAVLGLAVDGDADRFGVVDSDGAYIHANHILGLLLDYLVETRGWKGEVVRTVPTSLLVGAVAAHHGCTVTQTPTGFKYIGARLVASPETFFFGGEESNGLTVRNHIPEKDGILACLLVAEMVAAKGDTVRGCLNELFTRVGEREVDRLDLELPNEAKDALLTRLKTDPPRSIGSMPVTDLDTMDGFKFNLANGGFIAIRASGTEPLVRCYLDAPNRDTLDQIRSAARELVNP